jgi:hypothetical protein
MKVSSVQLDQQLKDLKTIPVLLVILAPRVPRTNKLVYLVLTNHKPSKRNV